MEVNAAKESRISREQLRAAAEVHQTVRQYLQEVERQNPVERTYLSSMSNLVEVLNRFDEEPLSWRVLHSRRSATMWSMRMARRAGIEHAANATSPTKMEAPAKVAGS